MEKDLIKLLEDIKKLIILQLVKGGIPASTEEIGDTLGISGRAVRNIATSIKKPRRNKIDRK